MEGGAMTVPLDALLRRMSRIAEDKFNKDGDIDMIWLVETASGEQSLIVSPIIVSDAFGAHRVKNLLEAKMREMFADLNIVRYARASECWTSKNFACGGTTDDELAQRYAAIGHTLENAPDRHEIVYIEAVSNHEYLAAMRDIIRPQHGKPYLSKLGEIERPKSVQGRWLDLLPREGATR
jgi:hypothetical protein